LLEGYLRVGIPKYSPEVFPSLATKREFLSIKVANIAALIWWQRLLPAELLHFIDIHLLFAASLLKTVTFFDRDKAWLSRSYK